MNKTPLRFALPCFAVFCFCLGLVFAVLPAHPALAATGQTITIEGYVGHDVYGSGDPLDNGAPFGMPPESATGNSVIAGDGVTVGGSMHGGFAYSGGDATADTNSVELSGNAFVDENVYGGYAQNYGGSATTNTNSVEISGGPSLNAVYGGNAYNAGGDATANTNSVEISSGLVYGEVFGGNAYNAGGDATANTNSVEISGGTVNGVYGGYAENDGTGTAGTASGNSVIISGGAAVYGNVYGGYSVVEGYGESGTATHNSVTISSAPIRIITMLYGGYVGDNSSPAAGMDAFSGNTLNLYSAGHLVAGLYNF
ncbi:MAG: hypothetical protein LBV80_11115 [Deltaproteobacteria bacterium]|nr:hypothetical protein [Deltaproteobacteria bacterium]